MCPKENSDTSLYNQFTLAVHGESTRAPESAETFIFFGQHCRPSTNKGRTQVWYVLSPWFVENPRVLTIFFVLKSADTVVAVNLDRFL